MTAEKIKNRILECVTLFGFEYDEKEGNVDPYYIPEKKSYEYLLFYDDKECTVNNIDDVMNTPFINGNTLAELAEKITVTEY